MSRRALAGVITLLALTFLGCSTPEATRSEPSGVLDRHVIYLAGDSLGGRLVGTPGIEQAARYIAREFKSAGLEPAFDGSYYQDFEIEFGTEVQAVPALLIGDHSLSYPADYGVVPISGSGSATGSAVFLGEGVAVDDTSLAGAIVFTLEDTDAEANRWALMGRDGLLDWMRHTCIVAADLDVKAVVFVSGSRDVPGKALHTFAVTRGIRGLDIPALEVTYAAVSGLLAAQDISIEAEMDLGSPAKPGSPGGASPLECEIAVTTGARTVNVRNVGGVIRGTGREDRYVVVGAHYDHLGYGDIASSTPWRREIHNGADDNASGVAAVLGIAAKLVRSGRPRQSVAFVCFTAEELGAIGSEYYCKNPPHAIDSTIAMINLDTVGRLEENRLIVFGARSAAEFSGILSDINQSHSLDLIEKKEIYGFSDQNPFYARGIPSLHFFTGAHDDYHSPDDDWQNINFEGLEVLTSFVADFVDTLAFTDQVLTPEVELEKPPETTKSRGRGAFLGIIPDFTYSGTGVGIKGTVPESPAAAAGLEDGDVILSIDGRPIADLQGLMNFLIEKSPGDEIEIRVMRGSAPATRKATLGVRSPRQQSE